MCGLAGTFTSRSTSEHELRETASCMARILARDGLLRPQAGQEAWRAFPGGRSENALRIWALLSFQSWRHRWLA